MNDNHVVNDYLAYVGLRACRHGSASYRLSVHLNYQVCTIDRDDARLGKEAWLYRVGIGAFGNREDYARERLELLRRFENAF